MQETTYHLSSPVSIALLSDIHERPYDAVLASLRNHRPDLIAVAGDLLYGSDTLRNPADRIERILRDLNDIAPTFMSLGNHEWQLSGPDIRRLPSILDNRWVSFRGVAIGGLSSAIRTRQHVRRPDPSLAPNLSWLPDFCKVPGFRILLCHHPEYYPRYLKDLPLDLVLSGHAHGGQWRLFGQGIFAPGQGLFPKLTSGVHFGNLVISRGLSNTAPFPRFFNPMEIVYLPAASTR